jgi:hypothetical protein
MVVEAGLIAVGGSLLLLIPFLVSFPTSETLARWYLGEVITGTNEELQTPYLRCAAYYVQRDRALYGGSEVRNVLVSSSPGGGSSDTIEFVSIDFEYRRPGASDWQPGFINTVMTDFRPLQTRWLYCSG